MKQLSLLIIYLLLSTAALAQYTGVGPVTLSGLPAGATGIQWYKDGTAISGATTSTYSATAQGTYYATYTNTATTCTADRTVTFILINSGQNATLTGATNNSTGSAYQWYNAGTAVSGATTANYTTSTGGLYSLKYNNGTCEIETQKYYVFTLISPLTAATPTAQTAATGEPKTGTASTELSPTGGSGPYVYSNGSADPACTAPAGATALPASSNLTVTNSSTGAYTYTAPTTAGTYYFCIKVCDSTTPTPQCVVRTYTVTVTASCNAGTAAPLLLRD